MAWDEKLKIIRKVYFLHIIGVSVMIIIIIVFGEGPVIIKPPFISKPIIESYPILFLDIVAIGPILEELMFRGSLILAWNWISKRPLKVWMILLMAFLIIFSVVFFAFGHFRALAPTLFLCWIASLYSWETIKTRYLWPSIVNHTTWNFTVVTLYLITNPINI